MIRKAVAAGFAAAALACTIGSAQAEGTGKGDLLDAIKARGELHCGTLNYLPGVGFLDDKGQWSGFDVDFCKAAAAAILGDASKVRFTALTGAQMFPALQSGEIDILSRSVTDTISRETKLGLDFIGPNHLTGQGFMVHKSAGVTDVKGLDGATICVLAGTVTEGYLADWFRAHGMSFTPAAAENSDQMFSMYFDDRCDAVTMEPPYLAIRRSRSADPAAHVILKTLIAKSFEAPVILEGSPKLREVLQWMHWGMVTAEELGITSANAAQMKAGSKDPVVRRFLGVEGTIGQDMGVPNDWMLQVVEAVGNYGEMYDRNLGKDSKLGVPRGMNALWRDGGAMIAPGWQ
ncbi:general L-amino acid transport system substrate-binding protein [Tistlia consotensis]|uniref:General L-amino acid transport system substrate-binding protein n=1 Tax=Tistlia consotensis USBA 355 TaxID=560819 RepID=A0A1Y6CQB0_9PROT|nr:transporter substrate-binding domain-containing protein [Tistlia consotensis]SMF82316.1 general L-amino acid transport system substrate-binding protein [Tistlia consotensis USBA 355]SNS27793.1 general L-amino acid transport system substrate-binding protein [Tistlia consotensis]